MPWSPRPERGVGQGTFSMPLWRGFPRRLWFDALFFSGQPPMARRQHRHPSLAPGMDESFPLDRETWAKTISILCLSPQQARIVELLLLGMRDKQIAAQMGLKVPTVRTYLDRIFKRVGVQDRVELILRVFSIALSAIPPGKCSQHE